MIERTLYILYDIMGYQGSRCGVRHPAGKWAPGTDGTELTLLQSDREGTEEAQRRLLEVPQNAISDDGHR